MKKGTIYEILKRSQGIDKPPIAKPVLLRKIGGLNFLMPELDKPQSEID